MQAAFRRGTAAAVAAILMLAPVMAKAGGAIGWANAVNEFSTEGIAVGSAAVILGIIAVGAILMFGITGLITTVVMVCLGGALMANADAIAGALFAGGAGGGSMSSCSRQVVVQTWHHRPQAERERANSSGA